MTDESKPAVLPVDDVFDLLRGVAALTGSRLVADIAETLTRHPGAPLANALNHKQVACKSWLVDALAAATDRRFEHILIAGGWLGALSAMLLDRLGDRIGHITTLDIDPLCKSVAETLNRHALKAGRFRAVTADMLTADLAALADGRGPIDSVINTSCEHLPDVRAWLNRLPRGLAVVLQSNDYFSEPGHVSSVADLDAFVAQAALSQVDIADALHLKNYTRFMLIGRV